MKNLPSRPICGNVDVMPAIFAPNPIPPGTRFLAFSGKKQVGKDTSMAIAKQLLEEAGHTVQFAAFAEPLKDKICIEILGLERSKVYGSNADKDSLTSIRWDNFPLEIRIKYSKVTRGPRSGYMTYREVMQVVGTDIFRKMLYDLVWAESPFRRQFNAGVVILTDLRFPNEKICTEERGGVIIRLERKTGLVDDHESETALDGVEFKYRYENNGSLDDLRSFIRKVLAENNLI